MQRNTPQQVLQVPASPFLTEVEAAAYLRLSPKTLTKWRSIGRGPRFTKIGRLPRYRLADLEKWLSRYESDEEVA